MNLELWYIGRPQQTYIDEGIKLYTKRIKSYINFKLVQCSRIKNGHKLSKQELLSKEAKLILSKLIKSDFLVLLDEKGKNFNSVEFSSWVEKHVMLRHKRTIFLIGGVYGFHDELKQKANLLISLSRMTLAHELARLLFVEQLYRSFSILNNEPYHNP